MLALEEAIRMLDDSVEPVRENEELFLAEAVGRRLAEDVKAPCDQPPFPRSPLDGYAVRGEDTKGASGEKPAELKVMGKIYAGQVYEGSVQAGECIRLMTGSPIPHGANAVVRQEDTDFVAGKCDGSGKKDGLVSIYKGVEPFQNYVYQGEDYRQGDVLLKEGTILNGMCLGIAAGAGRDRVKVYREPVITVISTGDEVMAPGEALISGKIYDSNRFTVVGRLGDLGFHQVESFHSKDDPEAMEEGIREAAKSSDLIITTGGVSVGEKDIMHQVMEDLEGERLFWRVSLKPGAPTLAFRTGKANVPVICLTGNPYGVAVNFELLVRPVLKKLSGNPAVASRTCRAVLVNDSPKRGGVRRFMRGVFEEDKTRVTLLSGSHASGTLSSMAASNCLVEIPENGKGKKGDQVKIYLL